MVYKETLDSVAITQSFKASESVRMILKIIMNWKRIMTWRYVDSFPP